MVPRCGWPERDLGNLGHAPRVDRRQLERIARRQMGLFTRAQARESSFTAKMIRARVRSGAWQPVNGRVLANVGVRLTPRIRDRAAQLAVPGSVLAGASAARVWGIPTPDAAPCLALTRDGHPSLSGVRLLRTAIDRRDILMSDGSALTSRERTVFDCLRLLPVEEAADLLDRALQQRWITIENLTLRLHAHVGRLGAGQIRRLLRSVRAGTRSSAERLLAKLLRGAGIDGWVANLTIADERGIIGVGDFVFGRARLVVEIDGFAFHTTPDRFQRDRERQNRLVAAGWTVLRFTWRDLNERPDHVIRTIRAMLARLTTA